MVRTCLSGTRRCVSRIYLWPLGRDERSAALVMAGGIWRSNEQGRVHATGVRAWRDQLHACEGRSISCVEELAAVGTLLLHVYFVSIPLLMTSWHSTFPIRQNFSEIIFIPLDSKWPYLTALGIVIWPTKGTKDLSVWASRAQHHY